MEISQERVQKIVEFLKQVPFDQTFWKSREEKQMGWKFPLRNIVKTCYSLIPCEKEEPLIIKLEDFYMNILNGACVIIYYLQLFESILIFKRDTFFVLIHRAFRIYDDDHSLTLSLDEFSTGLQDYGVNLSDEVRSDHRN